jgi:hypothetical protein
LPNVLDQRFTGDPVQRFTGEAGRPPACWDDGGDPAHELALVIDPSCKDKLGVEEMQRRFGRREALKRF